MCSDGLFALMEGRGCQYIDGDRVDGDDGTWLWTSYYCSDEPTCDRLHTETFYVVAATTVIPDHFGNDYHTWCADNNVTVLGIDDSVIPIIQSDDN